MERLEGGLEDMSMYYTYYLGYVDENKKLVPLGPFDNEGNFKELFRYSHSTTYRVHDDFYRLSWDALSEEFKEILGKEFNYSEGQTFKDVWSFYSWGYMPLNEFINGVKSMQHFIKSGYWEMEEIETFLSLPEDEKEDYICYGNLPYPLRPEVYAAMVAADPEVAKKYMYYAVCDIYVDDYYRYLAYLLSYRLIDEYKPKGEYVIFYNYS